MSRKKVTVQKLYNPLAQFLAAWRALSGRRLGAWHVYDLAWLARLAHPDHPDRPCAPEALAALTALLRRSNSHAPSRVIEAMEVAALYMD